MYSLVICSVFVSITVMYSEQVPNGGPPSFSGRLAKFSYKLTVGVQKPGCTAKITRLPFRVMVIPGELIAVIMPNVCLCIRCITMSLLQGCSLEGFHSSITIVILSLNFMLNRISLY